MKKIITKVKQKFCKHKNAQWYEEEKRSLHLGLATPLHLICDDCHKDIKVLRLTWEEYYRRVKNKEDQ